MEKSLFEQMGGTYTQVGDYLIPNLTLTEEKQKPIGIWGQQLKATDQMVWVGKLNAIRSAAMEVVNRELIFV